MTREELALEAEYLDLLDKAAAAKASGDREQLRAAKRAVYDFRCLWRGIRDAFTIPGEGVATPPLVSTKAKAH